MLSTRNITDFLLVLYLFNCFFVLPSVSIFRIFFWYRSYYEHCRLGSYPLFWFFPKLIFVNTFNKRVYTKIIDGYDICISLVDHHGSHLTPAFVINRKWLYIQRPVLYKEILKVQWCIGYSSWLHHFSDPTSWNK